MDRYSCSVFLSSAKLLRLLRVPVVLVKTNGGYLANLDGLMFDGKAKKLKSRFRFYLDRNSYIKMELSTIDRLLNDALCYDAIRLGVKNKKAFNSKSTKGAESLELALYICPRCGERASMHSSGNLFTCRQCGFSVEYQYNSSFLLRSEGNRESYLPPFDEAPFSRLNRKLE